MCLDACALHHLLVGYLEHLYLESQLLKALASTTCG